MRNDAKYYSLRHKIKINAKQNNRELDLLLSFIWSSSLNGESWKEILGYDSKYYISSHGRVLSLCRDGYKLLKPYINHGYYYVHLRKNKKEEKPRVNRLVANAFVDNPENKPLVHHKDRNKLNNYYKNLMFVSYEEHAKIHNGINV